MGKFHGKKGAGKGKFKGPAQKDAGRPGWHRLPPIPPGHYLDDTLTVRKSVCPLTPDKPPWRSNANTKCAPRGTAQVDLRSDKVEGKSERISVALEDENDKVLGVILIPIALGPRMRVSEVMSKVTERAMSFANVVGTSRLFVDGAGGGTMCPSDIFQDVWRKGDSLVAVCEMRSSREDRSRSRRQRSRS